MVASDVLLVDSVDEVIENPQRRYLAAPTDAPNGSRSDVIFS